MWPKDNGGGGRLCTTDVARTRHYGCWNKLTGRRNEIRLASRNTATNFTLRVFSIIYFRSAIQDDVMKRTNRQKTRATAWLRVHSHFSLLSNPMAILDATYEKVVRLFDDYQSYPGTDLTTEILLVNAKILSRMRLLTITRRGAGVFKSNIIKSSSEFQCP